jgi:hypothetical protein
MLPDYTQGARYLAMRVVRGGARGGAEVVVGAGGFMKGHGRLLRGTGAEELLSK